MSNDELKKYKDQMELLRTEADKKSGMRQNAERHIEVQDKQKAMQIFIDWLEQYKKKHPGFKENENNFTIDENGIGWICFADPDAEEDFVRNLALMQECGCVTCENILIATFNNGKLIDPRTNEEFPEGSYSKLIQKLDAGIAYDDIPLPESTTPNPFKMNYNAPSMSF